MYVRGARNREEVWLLDQIERMTLDESAFRSRDYVIAIDEVSNKRAGFGRRRIHKSGENTEYCELTSIGVIESWRNKGVGAHIVERLVELARDDGFEEVFAFTSEPEYLAQFGFEPIDPDALAPKLADRLETKRSGIDPDAVPLRLVSSEFEMPQRLRERFKKAGPDDTADSSTTDEDQPVEDFGIDPETATYKYDTEGRLD